MFKIQSPENDMNYALFERYLAKSFSFAVTGLTTILRLLLIQKIQKITDKKILVITSTEQNALKYQNDLKKAFGVESDLLPFQNISMYESVPPNRYDYAEQVRILLDKPDVIIAPVKTLLEKFPDAEFYKKNSINLKVGDEIDVREIAQKFVDLGYKHSTMVSDIGEFSIRGDIIDIFSLDKNAVRIELWGDEIVDIRYFNNETQKSIEKVKSAKIMPLYKFTLNGGIPDVIKKDDEEGYFEGIDVYQSYFNDNLVSVLDYLKSKVKASDTKIMQALQLVKLKSSLHTVFLNQLTHSELKKMQLALVLLLSSKVIICEYFFEDLIYSEKEYFKRFFRNLMYKKGISIIFIENDMNFVCETVSKFYLFTKNGKYKLITDFYDDEIYQYVEMPYTVELVKFFESKGHVIDHDVTFNETLKAIYRGVQ